MAGDERIRVFGEDVADAPEEVIDEVEGPLGWELRAQVPVQLPDGTGGFQVVRFVGVDGPRWFLRGVISGQGAVQPQAAGLLEQIFRDTVVVRGDGPMAPRDPIVLKLPEDAQMVAEGVQQDEQAGSRVSGGMGQLQRGPEITEVRYLKPVASSAGAALTPAGEELLGPGQVSVCCTTDDDVHAVAAVGNEPTVGIHASGGNIGTIRRRSYDPATSEARWFVSGWDSPEGGTPSTAQQLVSLAWRLLENTQLRAAHRVDATSPFRP